MVHYTKADQPIQLNDRATALGQERVRVDDRAVLADMGPLLATILKVFCNEAAEGGMVSQHFHTLNWAPAVHSKRRCSKRRSIGYERE